MSRARNVYMVKLHICVAGMSVEKLPKVIKLLSVRQNISPSRITREINSDRRTVEKVLKAGMDSGIIV